MQIHPSRMRSHAKMIGQMAIALAFTFLGRSVTPIFLLMDHFLPDFLRLAIKEIKSKD